VQAIGANATVICGNEIGAYAMVGAGAVITKPYCPYALVVGNPARQIGWVSEFGNRLNFDESGIAVCLDTGNKYKLLDNVVVKIE
jgi:UDP-2-acetamido-3-amino-2,3-dideoxy-glucuronate N-acetyltransferase